MLSGSDDLAPGVTFGGYVVRELIGRGGMASVYRAEHLLLEKPVALKVMDRSLLASSIGLARFLREGRVAAAIKHPNVVDVNDVGVHDDVPYLVMELLRGEDLDRHLRKQRQLDTTSTVRLALPVIAALHTAHTSGVVHRDIKPSNIFMSIGPDDQLVPKVLDFGISKMSLDRAAIERAATPQNQIIGTPQYLPPEALQGVGEMGPRSDQYSLGVVLYQCVTGRTPFGGDTLLALLESLARGAFPPPSALAPSVPAALERVILRALSPSPADRFPTIRDMGRALIELAAQRTQVVWRQSFATPAHGHDAPGSSGHGASTAGVDVPSVRDRVASSELSLTRTSTLGVSRMRRVALGAGLVLSGALAATLWSGHAQGPGERGRGPAPDVARGSLEAAAALPEPAASPQTGPSLASGARLGGPEAAAPGAIEPGSLAPSTEVRGLRPAPTDPPARDDAIADRAAGNSRPSATESATAPGAPSLERSAKPARAPGAKARQAAPSKASSRHGAVTRRAVTRPAGGAEEKTAPGDESAADHAMGASPEFSRPLDEASASPEPGETRGAAETGEGSSAAPGAEAREVVRGANGAPLLD